MTTGDNRSVRALYGVIRSEILVRLRTSRLAPVMSDVGKNSSPGFTDMGIVTGFTDLPFVQRFGQSLDKVEDADIAALILYLPLQGSLSESLSRLYEHIKLAPEGLTGLPYFDEWQADDDQLTSEVPQFWTFENQEDPRKLLGNGYRIAKSQLSGDDFPEAFVTIFVLRKEAKEN